MPVVLVAARHAAAEHGEVEGVGDRGLLEGALRAVGEARDHPRVLAPPLREALLGRRVAVRVLEALDVAHQQRGDPEAADEAEEVALHARAGRRRSWCRPRRPRPPSTLRIGPTVPSSSGFMTTTCLPCSMARSTTLGAVLDRAGHLEDAVDPLRVAQDERVLGVGGHPAAHRLAQRGDAVDGDRTLDPGVLEDAAGLVRMAVRDGDELHPARGVEDLVGHALGHEARADHGEADRLARRLALAERLVDHDHRATSVPAGWKSGHEASFSEMIATSRGHSIPKAGSF